MQVLTAPSCPCLGRFRGDSSCEERGLSGLSCDCLGTLSKAGEGGSKEEVRLQGFLGDYQEQGSSGRDMGLSAETCSSQLQGFLAR